MKNQVVRFFLAFIYLPFYFSVDIACILLLETFFLCLF